MNRSLAHQFTLPCLRGRADATYLERARHMAARPDFDWDAFLRFAFEERLPPLLSHALHGRDIVPPAVEKQLRRNYDFMAHRCPLLLHELSAVLGSLPLLWLFLASWSRNSGMRAARSIYFYRATMMAKRLSLSICSSWSGLISVGDLLRVKDSSK